MADSFQNEVPKARINLKLDLHTGGASKKMELPLKLLVTGDFSNGQESATISEREKINITKNNFDSVLSEYSPKVNLAVKNTLSDDGGEDNIQLTFQSMKDFTPEQVAAQIPQLKAMLAKHGIRHDTTVILYGRDVYAATRVAQIMLYAGVKDVRLLDGGWQTWSDAGLPVERGMPPAQQPAPDFGAPIPGQPQLMLDTEQARGLLHRQDASLVSVRSWPEFIGTTSGYSYIKPKGDIAGARWGHAGSDSTHMEDFHNPDGTMRSADDIATLWRQWNILPSQQVAFYCGTGWRASETFMYARAMGWPHVAVYDGGWYEWSSNPHNPVARGERGPESSQ